MNGLALLLSWSTAQAADGASAPGSVCVERLDREAFSTRLADAEAAWLDLDTARFRDRMNVLSGLVVPCLGDLVPPALSARWHRAVALRLEGVGDLAAAEAAILRARALDPALPFDDAWVGADHHLRTATAEDRGTRRVPEPRTGTFAFDGAVGRDRPLDRPTLFQQFDGAGVARSTLYLSPDDPLPPYAAVPRIRRRLLGAAAGGLLAGGAAIGAAYASQAALFRDSEDPDATADALIAARRRTDALAGAGYGLLGVTAAFGAAAIAVGAR
jgi:hypothetical protein